MSATLVSSNTTIKVNGAVSAANSAFNNTVTLYTAPANGYAIVQVYCTVFGGTTNPRVIVGGRNVFQFTSVNTSVLGLYVGPSQSLQISEGGGSTFTAVASGVEFLNTP